MSKDMFRAREEAEEAVYFQQRDVKLIEKLRERARLTEVAHALADKLAVDNEELLKQILSHGVTLETGGAFLLLPLIQVAWAEGKVTQAERDVVFHLAAERGIQPGTPDYTQATKWLETRPSDDLFDTAAEAVRYGLTVLPPAEGQQRVAQILETCRKVATASGGLGKTLHLTDGVSAQEQAVLDHIKARLARDAKNAK